MDGMLLCIPMVVVPMYTYILACILVFFPTTVTQLSIVVTCYKCMCTLLLVWMCGNSGGMGCFKYCYCWWVYCATVKETTPHWQSFMHALWITLPSPPPPPPPRPLPAWLRRCLGSIQTSPSLWSSCLWTWHLFSPWRCLLKSTNKKACLSISSSTMQELPMSTKVEKTPHTAWFRICFLVLYRKAQ